MQTSDTLGKKVAILATDYFEQDELISPMEALRDKGVEVTVIAPKPGEIKGLKHVEPGRAVTVDLSLDAAKPEDYDGLVIPGGVINADHLRMEQKARDFLTAMMAEHKPVAVICHGPWLLVSAGLVAGRTLTSYHTIADDIRNAGGEWVDKQVVIDGNLITSRQPDDLPAFNEAFLGALGSK